MISNLFGAREDGKKIPPYVLKSGLVGAFRRRKGCRTLVCNLLPRLVELAMDSTAMFLG